ncbi:MAG TPA: hypothetical protein PLU23_00685 [Anaerolineaceae bacterium]|nr:hypothetical protein [Anaerolineaceae bacterium]
MSKLLAAYQELETLEVDVPYQIKVYGLARLPESLTTSHLPARLLLPLSPTPAEGRDGHFVNIGNTVKVTWMINDLMLFKASEQGLGLRENAKALVEYCGAYAKAMKGKKTLGGCVVKSFSARPSEFAYPASGNRFYAGVIVEIQVEELL